MIEKLERLIKNAKNVSNDRDNSIKFESMNHDIEFKRSFDSGFKPYMEVSLNGIPYDRVMIDDGSRKNIIRMWEALKTRRFREESIKVDTLRQNVCNFMSKL